MVDLVTPITVADFLLCESRERGEILTNLKLQKLIYYAQAWYLVLKKCPLFEEDFEAWVHGPVLPSQYFRFSRYSWHPITDELSKPQIKAAIDSHLCEVVDVFGSETAVALELMTHREGPWIKARGDLAPDVPSRNPISKASMSEFYSKMQ
jgi:uncharacterized phage-associated protein